MVDLGHLQQSRERSQPMERRMTCRFPVHQQVRYRELRARSVSSSGTGKTLDVSSGGILFTTTGRLQPGQSIEVSMDWPARLHGNCPLQFVATGRVLRSDGKTAAVRIQRYEFRTRAAQTLTAGAAQA